MFDNEILDVLPASPLDWKQRAALGGLSVTVAVLCVVGWDLMYFICDDAYIAFRYVSNSQLGYGYVWNQPPFQPVEGYTSLLWVVLLDGTWTLTGLPPTDTANYLSLAFSMGSLAVAGWLAWTLVGRAESSDERILLVGLVSFGIVTNKTFLAWSSSGLETAMFNFFIHLWFACLVRIALDSRGWFWGLAASAALIHLTRPDGLLYVATTLGLGGLLVLRSDTCLREAHRYAIRALPLLVVPAKFVWRYSAYGAWLPNTYYAKRVELWPEAGRAYAAAFALEYALWLWLAFVLIALGYWLRRRRRETRSDSNPASLLLSEAVWMGAGTLLAHAGYYTLVVGGDHFEYRIYSHLVPFLFLALAWSITEITDSSGARVLLFVLYIAVSCVLPWTYCSVLRQDQSLTRPSPSFSERNPPKMAPRFPDALRFYTETFDELQTWLQYHKIAVRIHFHRLVRRALSKRLPSRNTGRHMFTDVSNPVVIGYSVGVLGWVLPKVHIIDELGLNDWVVARTPRPCRTLPQMAHTRRPPPGYLDAFDALATWPREMEFRPPPDASAPRDDSLTDEDIRQIEARYRHWIEQFETNECRDHLPPPPSDIPNLDMTYD
jgi:arabinofuranosyltransferase